MDDETQLSGQSEVEQGHQEPPIHATTMEERDAAVEAIKNVRAVIQDMENPPGTTPLIEDQLIAREGPRTAAERDAAVEAIKNVRAVPKVDTKPAPKPADKPADSLAQLRKDFDNLEARLKKKIAFL